MIYLLVYCDGKIGQDKLWKMFLVFEWWFSVKFCNSLIVEHSCETVAQTQQLTMQLDLNHAICLSDVKVKGAENRIWCLVLS